MLTAADQQHMEEEGYVVIPNAVPSEDLADVVDGIWNHMRMDRYTPDSWYEDPNGDKLHRSGFMRQMHTPAMWRVRQSPKIHRAFADLWGTDNLWITMDRCILKPPLRADRPEYGATGDPRGLLHWDFPAATTPKKRIADGAGTGESNARRREGRRSSNLGFVHPSRTLSQHFVKTAACSVPDDVTGDGRGPRSRPSGVLAELNPLGQRLLGLAPWPLRYRVCASHESRGSSKAVSRFGS
jgi:hypothetical protein